jgi:hypothetical protein
MSPESNLLLHHIRTEKPVPDRAATWLVDHRPSVAFSICIGAGPWRIKRRRSVQQSFIDALGKRDLSNLVAARKLIQAGQLDWQGEWFERINRRLRSKDFKPEGKRVKNFDDLFWPGMNDHLKKSRFELLIEMPIYKAPKVVQLFARDYLFIDCFPVDRHVREWLKERKLPTNPAKVMRLFKELGRHASGYSRAIFNSKAENATFEPTR